MSYSKPSFFHIIFICVAFSFLSFGPPANKGTELSGEWTVQSWVEKNGGGLVNGKLIINDNLIGTLTGNSFYSGKPIVQRFEIKFISDTKISMKGTVIKGHWYADNFTLDLNDSFTIMSGVSHDTAGDIIKAVFVKNEAPAS